MVTIDHIIGHEITTLIATRREDGDSVAEIAAHLTALIAANLDRVSDGTDGGAAEIALGLLDEFNMQPEAHRRLVDGHIRSSSRIQVSKSMLPHDDFEDTAEVTEGADHLLDAVRRIVAVKGHRFVTVTIDLDER